MLAFARGLLGVTEGWVHSGLANRMAFEIGLHRDCESGQWIFPALAKSDIETRKFAWWGVYIVDRMISLILGRPLAINDHDFDTRFP
ncbi:hypothetical protein GQ42DRAFT_121669, partial [Ramicandelaber brevisporus]